MKQSTVRNGNIRYTQGKQGGYAWNVRNCMNYMKENYG